MARLKGIIKLEGSIGDITFYNSIFGLIVREKGGADKERIKNDPAFINTRKHNAEFGACSKAGKLFRQSVFLLAAKKKDHARVGAVNKMLFEIKNKDTFSAYGERTPARGIMTAEGKALLNGFNIEGGAALKSVLKKSFSADLNSGTVSLNNFVTNHDLIWPKGATHVVMQSGFIKIDFEKEEYESQYSATVTLSLDEVANNVLLTAPIPTVNFPLSFMVLKIGFLQEINGMMYDFTDNAVNVLAVVSVG